MSSSRNFYLWVALKPVAPSFIWAPLFDGLPFGLWFEKNLIYDGRHDIDIFLIHFIKKKLAVSLESSAFQCPCFWGIYRCGHSVWGVVCFGVQVGQFARIFTSVKQLISKMQLKIKFLNYWHSTAYTNYKNMTQKVFCSVFFSTKDIYYFFNIFANSYVSLFLFNTQYVHAYVAWYACVFLFFPSCFARIFSEFARISSKNFLKRGAMLSKT